MKNLKKIFSLVLAGTMAMTVLAGCGNSADDGSSKNEELGKGTTENSKDSDKLFCLIGDGILIFISQ